MTERILAQYLLDRREGFEAAMAAAGIVVLAMGSPIRSHAAGVHMVLPMRSPMCRVG